MEKVKLSFETTFKDSISIAMGNLVSILGCVVLWMITIWVPYINIGTTIAIALLPAELAKGNKVSPTSIFDAKYRDMMGDYFLIAGLVAAGVGAAYLIMFIPGIIMGLAWTFAILLVIDKGMKPFEALKKSFDLTNGNKMTMFLVSLVFVGAFFLIYMIILLLGMIAPVLLILGMLVVIVLGIVVSAIMVGVQASFYRQLVLGQAPAAPAVEEKVAE